MTRSFCIALLTVFPASSGCSRWAEQRFVSSVKNRPASNFSLDDLDGTTVKLSEFKGKSVLVAFFAFG